MAKQCKIRIGSLVHHKKYGDIGKVVGKHGDADYFAINWKDPNAMSPHYEYCSDLEKIKLKKQGRYGWKMVK